MTIVIPQHEQHYPTKLLAQRLEEYVSEDGRPPSINRAFAKKLKGEEVLAVVNKMQTITPGHIDPRYFVATCFHESGCINEWDTEVASSRCIEGFESVGAYQIGKEEAMYYGFSLTDMLNLEHATYCMIRLANDNRVQIRQAANLANSSSDPDYIDENGVLWKAGTMRAYLAICHNHGVGYTRTTIARYGLDWSAYKKRNPTDNIVAHSYGEDCVTGGTYYPKEDEKVPIEQRTLQLTNPFMNGNDVRELQRHLKLVTDGVFGPGTETALIQFQKSRGLKPDGVCGPVTWAALMAR